MEGSPNHRVRPDAGWVDDGKRRATCRCGCGQPVPKGRRTFASDACVDGWKIQTQPAYVRQRLWERDHGVCGRCGTDTEVQRAELVERWREEKRRHWWVVPPASRWQAHHKVAVAEGGGLCGLDGYETLCHECHAAETAELRRRLAEARKAAKAAVGDAALRPEMPGLTCES